MNLKITTIFLLLLSTTLLGRPQNQIFNHVRSASLFTNYIGINKSLTITGNLIVSGLINGVSPNNLLQGPLASTINAVARFGDTNGTSLLNSSVLIDDAGNVTLNGITKNGATAIWPSIVGSVGTFLGSDGTGNLVYGTPLGGGNVLAAVPFTTDNAVIRVDLASGVHNIKQSGVVLDNSNNVSGINSLTATTVNANVNGNASSATNFLGNLSGDVTGTQSATVVNMVDGQTAANVGIATAAANAATASNTTNTIVKRDGLGNFSASTISANLTGNVTGNLNGTASNATNAVNATTAVNLSGSLAGDVTGTQPATIVAQVGGQSAANVALATIAANTATALNTANTIVKRDNSGNFAAGNITANLSGNVVGNVNGNADTATTAATTNNFSGNLTGDVTGTQSATVVSSVGGQTATNVAAGTTLANNATNNNAAGTLVRRDGFGNFSAGTITANIAGDVTGNLIGNASTATSAITATTATNFSGNLTGDVTGTQPATAVSTVGGQTAANVAAGTVLANNATATNTTNTIVKRDNSGNFAAGTITANLAGNVTGNLIGNASTATSATNFSGNLSGDVTGTQSSTVVSTVGGQTAANVAAGTVLANNATNNNTASTIVRRDSSGNFSAGTISASLTGNVTGNLIGNASTATSATTATTATNFSGNLTGDVTGTQPATVVSTVGGQSAANIATATVAANTATPINTANTIVQRDASGNFAAGIITANLAGNVTGNLIGNANTATTATNFSGNLSGDVTGTQSATVVNMVDGQTATNVGIATAAANAATASNTTNTIVKRDGSGNFSAGTISASLTGNVTGNLIGNASTATSATTATTSTNFSGNLTGDVTGTQSATVVSTVGGQSAANIATATVAANNATPINTASTIVQRDASGNFAAGNITANLSGNVVGNLNGNADTATTATTATNFSNPLGGDVTGNQPTTVVSFVGGQTAANVAAGTVLANSATNNNIPSTLVRRDGSGNFNANIINATFIGNITGNLFGNATTATSATTAGTSTNFSGSLAGDVTGIQAATIVSFVGGQSAANVSSATIAANAATNTNTPNTIVERDSSGNFIAGDIQADLIGDVTGNLFGNASTATSATTANNFSGSLTGDVIGTQSATQVSMIGGQTAANVAAGTVLANNSTNNNVAGTIIRRDSSGNFNAGTINATFIGNITGNLIGNAATATNATFAVLATNFSGGLGGDVTGTQAATVVAKVGGQNAADVASATIAANAATSTNTANTIVERDSFGNFTTNMVTLSGTVTNPTDATTKQYVDAAVSTGLIAKQPAVVVSLTNITLTGTQTIDGVALIATNRVLLVGQTNPVQNGLWVVQVSAWTRPTDFASGTEADGAYVLITSGAVNAGSSWLCSTPTAIIDTDPITFVEFSLPGQTTAANVGTGTGQIFRDKTGVTLNLKTLAAATHMVVTNNTNDVTLSTDATDSNTASTIVARDASGNFSAGTITAALTGSASNNVLKAGDTMTGNLGMALQSAVQFQDGSGSGKFVGLQAPATIGTSYTTSLPASAPTTGQYLQASSSSSTQWATVGGSPSIAKIYYVALNGNDSNDGSLAAPFLTVSHALSVANTVATLTNPVIIQIGAGRFTENNSGGPLTITANGISVIGSSQTGTIIIPNTISNDLFSITTPNVYFANLALTTTSAGSTANAINLNVSIAGTARFNLVIVAGFQTGFSLSSSTTNTIVILENIQTANNGTNISINNLQGIIQNSIFQGPTAGTTPVNTGIFITGSNTIVAILNCFMRLFNTAISVTGGAQIRVIATTIGATNNSIVGSGGASLSIMGCSFFINNSSSVNVAVSGTNTNATIDGSHFQCNDLSNTPQGIAIEATTGATLCASGSSIENAVVGIACGTSGDTSSTILRANGLILKTCTNDIIQTGSSLLEFISGLFTPEKTTIADPTNVSFAAFDDQAVLVIGTNDNISHTVYEVLNGQLGIEPNLHYEPNYYGAQGTIYENRSSDPTVNGTQAASNNASYYIVTGDRTKTTSINLISDTANLGNGDNVRGWALTKAGTGAGLAFSYSNNDTSGQAARGSNAVINLNGFDNQLEFPTATITPLPTNTVAKLVWAGDTNLYRASSNTLQTDGNVIVAGLTPNTAITTNGSDQLTSSITTATELGYLSGVTSPIQTQINGKVSKSGDTMTGALQLPAGTTSLPSLIFTGSTTTGLSANSNNLSFSTAGTEAMKISSAGIISIDGLTSTGVVHNDSSGNLSSSLIINADVDPAAAIVDTKLATISTTGKVSNSATTATSANTANAIVARDASGNFSAGTITATLTGAASLNVLRAGDTMTGNLTLPAGSAAIPSLQFSTNTNTGISANSNNLALSTAGAQRVGISSAGVVSINGFTAGGIVHNDSSGNLTSSLIVNADIDPAAAIVDSKLATISTAGKVSNSATTATSANNPSTIVARDVSDNFSAGTITATLTGAASLNVLKAGDTMTGNLQLPAGTTATPSLQFTGSTTSGLSASANNLSLSTAGVERMKISSGGTISIDGFSSTGIVHNDSSGNLTSSLIVNADIDPAAAITDSKLATISTAGKVSNSATTATSANTANAIVARDASGNFSAGTITATLTGAASLNVLKAGDTMTGSLQLPAGTTSLPSLNFTSSPTTGLSANTNNLSFSTSAVERMKISSGGTISIDGFSSTGIVHNDSSGNLTTSLIVNADIDPAAAITDSKLATISTAGKVANSATTATSANTANAIVARDASGNFSAGTITATLTGAASLNVLRAGDTMTGSLQLPAGTTSLPSLNFTSSPTTGLSANTNNLSFSTSAVERMKISSAGTISIDGFSSTGIVHNDSSGNLTSSLIVNADIDPAAAIVDSKLATISTAGKVSNSATTATSTNTASTIVARDASGNFSAGTITATLTGAASLNVLRAGDTMTGNLQIPGGSTSLPSLNFTSSPTTGLSASTDNLSFSTAGTERMKISSAGIVSIDGFTATGIVHNDNSGNLSNSLIVNADISTSAAIVDSKLATISTAGKVANSATTATSANTANAIVARDASGNFSAGTITATLTGAASLNVLRAGDTMTGNLQIPAGTTAVPSLQFTGSTTSGLSASANNLSLSTAGVERMKISSAGIISIDGFSSTGIVHNDSSGNLTTSLIVNADVDPAAAITDSKLATISTAGKVANSATTATSANTASTIVARDISGNFSAGTITATLTGAASLNVLKTGDTMTGNLQLPAGTTAAPSLQFTGSTTSGLSASANNLSLSTAGVERMKISSAGTISIDGFSSTGIVHNDSSGNLTTSLIVNADVDPAAAITDSKLATISTAGKVANSATTATSLNTPNSIVARDVLGNFTAGIIFANLSGNATTATTATNFSGSLTGDVTGTQSATVVSSVGGQTAANVAAGAVLANNATNNNTANTIVKRDASGNFSAGTITASFIGNVTGAASLDVLKAGDTMTGTLTHPAGTAAAPSIQFTGSTNTGFSAATANTLSFDTNGTERMNISTTNISLGTRTLFGSVRCDQAILNAAPATNATVTATSTTSIVLLKPTANVTNVTVVFPPTPTDGQFFSITCSSHI